MKRIAIKGHSEGGSVIIELLKSLGGKNEKSWRGDREDLYYFIDKYNKISVCTVPSYVKDIEFTLYTYEEIKKLFPYEVGDKVIYKTPYGFLEDTVRELYSDGKDIQYFLKSNSGLLVRADELCYRIWTDEPVAVGKLTPESEYKKIIFHPGAPEKTELDLGDDFEIVIEGGKILVVKKKTSGYPKDYEKCYSILYPHQGSDEEIQNKLIYQKSLDALDKLIICRNAYWKIDNNWRPDWKDNYQKKYTISIYQDEIEKTSGPNVNRLFVFSSSEIRDDFYKNFKELFEDFRLLYK